MLIDRLGNWVEDKRQGKGIQIWPDGRRENGEWYNDNFIGNDVPTQRYVSNLLSNDRYGKDIIDKMER